MSALDPMEIAESQRLAIVHEFLSAYLTDRAAGVTRSLDDYRAAFPGFEEVVAAEWYVLTASEDRRIGPYAVIRELGAGGQAVVYLAADERLGRRVALKVLPRHAATPQQEARLRREARVTARWSDPRICEVYDIGSDDAHLYVAMQYVEGETLAARIARGPIDTMMLLSAFEQLARSLERAHEAGIVHRDIKPGNIMMSRDGEPVLLDFGLALDASADAAALTGSGDLFGTPAYLAPELLAGEVERADAGSDVYSLAVSLFEALTLKRPFEAPTREA